MAPPLLKLALQYQHALDGHDPIEGFRALGSDSLTSSIAAAAAAGAAGRALLRAVATATQGGTLSHKGTALEPIILWTQLASSLVTHLESIPWGAVTLQMLRHSEGTPFSEALLCGRLLAALIESVMCTAALSDLKSPAAALMLR